MQLFEEWKQMAYEPQKRGEYEKFWNKYIPVEEKIYKYLLENHTETVSGTLKELSDKFKVEPVTFTGFLDGINTSLKTEINLEELEEESDIELDIDLEKLYFNMLDAQADWLYNLKEWDEILTSEDKERITKEYKKSKTVVKGEKIGRNDLCPCGSGKKYKKCCGKKL